MKKILKLVSALILGAVFLFSGCSDGSDGVNGSDGSGITWKGSYSSSSDSALSNPQYLWAYYNTSDECSYLWNGEQWVLFSGTKDKTFDVEIVKLSESNFKKVNFRVPDPDSESGVKTDEEAFFNFCFLNGKEDIPYVLLNQGTLEATIVTGKYETHYTVSNISSDSTSVTITNSGTDTKAVFDLKKHTLTFDNYDLFFKQAKAVNFDITNCEQIDYLKISDSAEIAGQSIVLDWSSQDIGVIVGYDGDSYQLLIPFQTYNDIFLSANNNPFIYNGAYLYYYDQLGSDENVRKDFYSVETKDRSTSLAEFCYNELCLNLDFNYGLKAIHGIESFPDFDTYFAYNGLRDSLKSTKAEDFATAVKDICNFYFNDGHSAYKRNSYYLGPDSKLPKAKDSRMDNRYFKLRSYYSAKRDTQIGSGEEKTDEGVLPAPCYQVSKDGKTAIVRFDSFTDNGLKSEGLKALESKFTDEQFIKEYVSKWEDDYDTIAMIHCINKKIQEDSNIENVVLDLSLNGGGAARSAVFIIAWMLGECTADIQNKITGAKSSITYQADVDFDGEFAQAGDTVFKKNLFCLISPVSFSCGNFLPAVLKASGFVTILGSTSGGGAAAVHSVSAADTTQFQISSKNVISVDINGSSYDVDKGVEPHYYINKAENFYNIEKISALVNQINAGNVPATN